MGQICADVKSSLNLTPRLDTRLSLKKLEADQGEYRIERRVRGVMLQRHASRWYDSRHGRAAAALAFHLRPDYYSMSKCLYT